MIVRLVALMIVLRVVMIVHHVHLMIVLRVVMIVHHVHLMIVLRVVMIVQRVHLMIVRHASLMIALRAQVRAHQSVPISHVMDRLPVRLQLVVAQQKVVPQSARARQQVLARVAN